MKTPQYSNLPARFWDKVEVQDSGCWEWQAALWQGYGAYHLNGKTPHASRVAAIDAYGEQPSSVHALHHCDNPPCVNPKHLYFGSHQQNMADMARRGKANRPQGSAHPDAKLTEESVAFIRDLYSLGNVDYKWISDAYGLSESATGRAITGKTWSHVK